MALDEAHGTKLAKIEKKFTDHKIKKKKSLPVGSRWVGSVGPPETQAVFKPGCANAPIAHVFIFWRRKNKFLHHRGAENNNKKKKKKKS